MQPLKSSTAATVDKFAALASHPRLRRWILVGALSLTAVFALVLVILWQLYVAAPEPAAICQHKMDLIARDTPQASRQAAKDLLAKLQSSCVEYAERRIRLEGKINYARYARCVQAAENLDQAERC